MPQHFSLHFSRVDAKLPNELLKPGVADSKSPCPSTTRRFIAVATGVPLVYEPPDHPRFCLASARGEADANADYCAPFRGWRSGHRTDRYEILFGMATAWSSSFRSLGSRGVASFPTAVSKDLRARWETASKLFLSFFKPFSGDCFRCSCMTTLSASLSTVKLVPNLLTIAASCLATTLRS